MGTKNNPASFDCYANAEPDEPMFILLARDPMAPILVKLWANLRAERKPEDSEQCYEAYECAVAMENWRKENRSKSQFVTNVRSCQRCGKDHNAMPFTPLSNPVDDWTYFGVCSQTQQPVMLKVKEVSDANQS